MTTLPDTLAIAIAQLNPIVGDIADAPTSRKDLSTIQDQMNRWAGETGLPYAHLSRILAMSIGESRSLETLRRRLSGEE
jgi:hypothetical protein